MRGGTPALLDLLAWRPSACTLAAVSTGGGGDTGTGSQGSHDPPGHDRSASPAYLTLLQYP
jgi:hypothetical protein